MSTLLSACVALGTFQAQCEYTTEAHSVISCGLNLLLGKKARKVCPEKQPED